MGAGGRADEGALRFEDDPRHPRERPSGNRMSDSEFRMPFGSPQPPKAGNQGALSEAHGWYAACFDDRLIRTDESLVKEEDMKVRLVALCLVGCGGVNEVDTSLGDRRFETSPDTIEIKGRVLLRTDLWAPEELERIRYEGRPELPSTTREVLAAQLRAVVFNQHGEYIELEPNVELADRILSDDRIGTKWPQREPREARNIMGPDTRAHAAGSHTDFPNRTFGFEEIGCSGVKIGPRTLYTAAHCLYKLKAPKGWYCRDGTTATNPYSCAPGMARWRFGVEDGQGYSNWLDACWSGAVAIGFTGLSPAETTSQYWLQARFDYAALNLNASCATASTGALGAMIPSDVDLTNILYNFGYPLRANCPDGTRGSAGGRGTGGTIINTDCPGTGSWPGSTWRYTGGQGLNLLPPYSGAELWGMNQSLNSKGDEQPNHTIRVALDITEGQSGAPIYLKDGNERYVFGVVSSGGTLGNRAQRFTAETAAFFEQYTDWPND